VNYEEAAAEAEERGEDPTPVTDDAMYRRQLDRVIKDIQNRKPEPQDRITFTVEGLSSSELLDLVRNLTRSP
jgi:hypothetical protein